MKLTIKQEMNENKKSHVNNKLYEYNLKHFPEDLRERYKEINLFLEDENGEVRGGLLAEVCWNWLEIHTLMVDDDIRGMGYGTELLYEVEKIALESKCDFIKVDTLSFQALGFYQKNEYEIYGKLENVGREFEHYYLKKDVPKPFNILQKEYLGEWV